MKADRLEPDAFSIPSSNYTVGAEFLPEFGVTKGARNGI